jgi:hypothetical protein
MNKVLLYSQKGENPFKLAESNQWSFNFGEISRIRALVAAHI